MEEDPRHHRPPIQSRCESDVCSYAWRWHWWVALPARKETEKTASLRVYP